VPYLLLTALLIQGSGSKGVTPNENSLTKNALNLQFAYDSNYVSLRKMKEKKAACQLVSRLGLLQIF
jgi:hypothetical protein